MSKTTMLRAVRAPGLRIEAPGAPGVCVEPRPRLLSPRAPGTPGLRPGLAVAWLAGVMIAAGPAVAQAPPKGTIRIANFNIQVFGTTNAESKSVMTVLSRIARQFDVMAVEEFRDGTGEVAQAFLDRINRDSDTPYAMILGPRLGRTNSKEQYAVYYRPSVVTFVDSFTVSNRGDRFERPPLVACNS